jgi:hypothetical protein
LTMYRERQIPIPVLGENKEQEKQQQEGKKRSPEFGTGHLRLLGSSDPPASAFSLLLLRLKSPERERRGREVGAREDEQGDGGRR